MTITEFQNTTLTFLVKGKKKSVIEHLTHSIDTSEKQIWITEDRLLLNAMFHLITANIQPTKGKVLNPLKKYYTVKTVSILNHFSLRQYIHTLITLAASSQIEPKAIADVICMHHDLSHHKLQEIVEYLPVETQIAISLSIAIILNIPIIFIQNNNVNRALKLLPPSLHELWINYLTHNRIIAMAYTNQTPRIDPMFKRIINLYPDHIVETVKES